MRRRARVLSILCAILINVTVSTSAAWGQEALQSTLGVEDDRDGADVLGAFKDSLLRDDAETATTDRFAVTGCCHGDVPRSCHRQLSHASIKTALNV